MAAPDPDLQRLCNDEDTPVESSILFPSWVVCNRPFDARGPYGTHSIWCYLFWFSPTSSGMAISYIFHVVPRAIHVILWLSGGVNC